MNDAIVTAVLHLQTIAAKRGALTIWTVYSRPKDYPAEYCARCHEVGKQGPTPTTNILVLDLEDLREVFRASGLVCVCRQEGDDPVIVESWV